MSSRPAFGLRFRSHGLNDSAARLPPTAARRAPRAALGTHPRVAQKQLAPVGFFRPSLERPPIEQRPPIQVVVDLAGQDEAVDERGVKKQLLEPLEGTEPDQVAAAQPHQVLADVKMPVLLRHFGVADNLDVARVADAQPVFVRHADVGQRHRIEPHQLGRHRIDGDLVARRQHHVLDHRIHGPRPRTVSRGRPVHDGEQPRVDLLLNREQIDERFVNPRVGVVPPRVQQAAERVLHRAGRRRVDVALHGRQVHDVLAEEVVGDADAFGKDVIERAHARLRPIAHPLHVAVLEVVEDGNVRSA